jgi:hypothetical protein
MPITRQQLHEQGFWEVLTDIFDEESNSSQLLSKIKFPTYKIPDFNSPGDFWGKVCSHIEADNNDFEQLIISAATMYPYQPLFNDFSFEKNNLSLSFEIFQKYFMDEFCKVFDYDDAMEILDKIGFPERYRPVFTNPNAFWRKICKSILNGRAIKKQSLHPLLDEAAKLCPYNDIFKNWNDIKNNDLGSE